MNIKYSFNLPYLEYLMDADGHNVTSLAAAMGVNHSSTSRVLAGKNQPGFTFLLGLKKAFPHMPLDYFICVEIVDE